MRGKARSGLLISSLALVAGIATACGSGSGSSGGPTATTVNPAAQVGEHNILPPKATGSPVIGGTLKIVGSGDVDKLDTCCAYYTVTYELLRAISRQLVSYQSIPGQPAPPAPVPDLATYTISPDGLTYTFTIKKGVMWAAPSGPRQITSQDEVRGIERLCNPVNPSPAIGYWEQNIAGMPAFCDGFSKMSLPKTDAAQATAIAGYMNSHHISGLSTPDSSTIKITLMKPAAAFINIMAMPMASPVPVEMLQYVPGSVQSQTHFISDGPYMMTSYTPGVSINLVKNPSWSQSTDTLRHQYFNAITVTEGQNPTTIQQELETGDADLEWDTTVPSADVESLSTSKQFVAAYLGGITYLAFNMHSTVDGGALQKPAVRKALQFCVNKRHIIQVSGGPLVNVPSNQILPPQILGFQKNTTYVTPNDDEGSPSKCKSMLAAAGYPNGLTLTLVYPNNPPAPDMATALQSDFQQAGVTLKLLEQPQQGEYFNYVETPANKAHWDIAFGAWFPDWLGNGAQSFFTPLFDGRLYGQGSTNYGDYNDPKANSMIDTALHATSTSAAAADWAAVDKYITDDNPGWIPLVYDALPQFIGTHVQNAIFNGDLGYVDITNVWKK
jgi:peptide/nickel transport system substrate-binding protein